MRSQSWRTKTLGALVVVLALVTVGITLRWRLDPHRWGAHRQTIETLAQMLHEAPCSPAKIRWLTWELEAANDRASAARYLDEVIAVCRLPADIHKIAFDLHVATGQREAAVQEASRRVLIDGRDASAYLDRARVYVSLGKPGYAMVDAEAAYRLGVRDEELLMSIARLYRLDGQPELVRR